MLFITKCDILDPMNFGQSLKKTREDQSLSQHELARKLDVAQSTIGMWELGRRTPKLSEIKRVAGILNTNINRLLGEEESEKKVEIIKNVVFIDGQKIAELNEGDVAKIIEHIFEVKKNRS